MKVTVKGISKARTQLKKTLGLSDALREKLTALTAARIRDEAYRRTPVRTGALRASGRVSVSADDITYTNRMPYDIFVEHGTGRRGAAAWKDIFRASKLEDYLPKLPKPAFSADWPGMEAQPFIRPAIVIGMNAFVNDLRELVGKAVYELYHPVTGGGK